MSAETKAENDLLPSAPMSSHAIANALVARRFFSSR